ncbi:hypothetical protein B296_00010345 [Ensete ventricosum]|uniref:Thioredoxin domain-containing protein n=1 Tax=Ensete ventricosum TaxID=4639 RepID=A0A426ZWJ2_ENSVE|nr:hypothetical protein B296_00010345 [Ensete ventricosum]
MLNVDNTKWEQELDEFGVEGIPHFAFLDKDGNEEGNVVGRLPRQYFLENVAALANGEPTIPHARVVESAHQDVELEEDMSLLGSGCSGRLGVFRSSHGWVSERKDLRREEVLPMRSLRVSSVLSNVGAFFLYVL